MFDPQTLEVTSPTIFWGGRVFTIPQKVTKSCEGVLFFTVFFVENLLSFQKIARLNLANIFKFFRLP